MIASRVTRFAASLVFACAIPAYAQVDDDPSGNAAFSFAVVANASANGPATTSMLRAIADGPARFAVHFETATSGADACAESAVEWRRALLDASAKPVVPVVAAVEWADCPSGRGDAMERLERVDELLFNGDESLGQAKLPWLRQSAVARFRRYRENVRWQSGRVLFATINLPADNNAFRFGAGRNGEFEERQVANRAWLERTFRLATERRLAGIVLFVDGAPRFTLPLRAPDNRVHERDGYYEFKLALRELAANFKGHVLLVQGHRGPGAGPPSGPDHPLRDATGKVVDNVLRLFASDDAEGASWLRIEVDPAGPALFRAARERLFDDPSGELYGTVGPR